MSNTAEKSTATRPPSPEEAEDRPQPSWTERMKSAVLQFFGFEQKETKPSNNGADTESTSRGIPQAYMPKAERTEEQKTPNRDGNDRTQTPGDETQRSKLGSTSNGFPEPSGPSMDPNNFGDIFKRQHFGFATDDYD